MLVAIGGHADAVRSGVDLRGAEVVVNDGYGEGCSSSIAVALGAVDVRGDEVVDVPVPGRIPLDVDTMEDYEAVLQS